MDRPCVPYFALGLVRRLRRHELVERPSVPNVDPLSHQPPRIVQLNFMITQLFLHQFFQEVRRSQRKETTDQVARC